MYRTKVYAISLTLDFCEAELALTTHQYKHTNTLYVNTVVHLPEVLKVELC